MGFKFTEQKAPPKDIPAKDRPNAQAIGRVDGNLLKIFSTLAEINKNFNRVTLKMDKLVETLEAKMDCVIQHVSSLPYEQPAELVAYTVGENTVPCVTTPAHLEAFEAEKAKGKKAKK